MSSSHFASLARELEENDEINRIAREERLAELRDIAARKRGKSQRITNQVETSIISEEDDDTE